MAKVENLDFPLGWLIDPHNKWAIHFDSKNHDSSLMASDFNIDMWGLDTSGKPSTFKSRRKVSKKDSIKTWKQLISSNWTELDSTKIKSA
tara:strand:- start:308 stop:577 length:270 start_codon:yes stop_codon:yes gene_type:complete